MTYNDLLTFLNSLDQTQLAQPIKLYSRFLDNYARLDTTIFTVDFTNSTEAEPLDEMPIIVLNYDIDL